MQFDFGSDLHLAYDKDSNRIIDSFPATRSPVLILAGDIAEIAILKGNKNKLRTQVVNFFTWVSQNYSEVLYVMGNHEYYDVELKYGVRNLRSIFAKLKLDNIKVLENETVEYSDAIVFGATMWTSCRNSNPHSINAIQAGMNDYQYIMLPIGDRERMPITPEYTIKLHKETRSSLANFIAMPTAKAKIVITHHAPHIGSIEPFYRNIPLTDAYYEELFELIFDSGIHTWIHGHTHCPSDYLINQTRVLANPRGYWGYECIANSYSIASFDSTVDNVDLKYPLSDYA